jgi:3-keto steroid reductase
MIYAALVSAIYLPPAEKVPSPKFAVEAQRWGNTKVKYGEVDRWEDADEIGQGMMRACEAVRSEWRRRESLE